MAKKDLIEIHNKAMSEFDRIQSTLRDERLQCLQDRRFYSIAGAQWEGPLGLQFENKPKLEVNKIHLAVIRIINEYRNNRITVNFIPKDGTGSDTLSDACQGMYRADEQDSCAEEAYDNAFEEAVGGGFGAWRLCNAYENEEDEDADEQKIVIEPIFDADSSVFFDLDAKRQDKADARRCYVLTAMSREAFIEEYGEEAEPTTVAKTIIQRQYDWFTPDVVYIAEYYVVESVSKVIVVFKGLSGDERKIDEEELKEDIALRAELRATGYRQVRKKTIKQKKVHKYIISGAEVLEDLGYIAGNNIPIVPVYGKRWFVENVERCMGHVRLAKDAQRLKNMQLSKLAETSAMATVAKPIFSPEQVLGHQELWAEDNIKNYPYMLLNPQFNADGTPTANGPIGYTKVPELSPALAALLQITEQDIKDLLGNQEAGEQMQSNISGVAVELIQNKLDMQTFIYISNMAKAVKRSGEIWLSMAREIFIEEGRVRKTVNQAGEVSSVKLLEQNVDPDTGVPTLTNDLSKASFDVTALPGPTSASKRAATVKGLVNLLQMTQDPETTAVLTSMIMMNMEGEGIEEIRDYFRKKLLNIGAVKPTDEEAQELKQAEQNKQPDPQALFLQASARQAEADAILKQANAVLAGAKAELTHAQTLQTMSDVHADKVDHTLNLINSLENRAAAMQQPVQPSQEVQPQPEIPTQ